jgi:hypothetical protein
MQSIAWALAVVAVQAVGTATLAAHLSVLKTFPADAATLTKSPERVQVWFNQQPSARISRLELKGPSGDVGLDVLEVHSQENSISAAIRAPLAPGRYEVSWRSAGADGHVMRGTFTFSISPAK